MESSIPVRHVALFFCLLTLGAGVLAISVGPGILLPNDSDAEASALGASSPFSAIVDRPSVRAENVDHTFTKTLLTSDGTRLKARVGTLHVEKGDASRGRLESPELTLFNGKLPPDEQKIAFLTAQQADLEGSHPLFDSPESSDDASGRIEFRDDVQAIFFAPQSGEDLVLRCDRLVIRRDPEIPDSIEVDVEGALTLESQNDTVRLHGSSLHLSLLDHTLRIGGPVHFEAMAFDRGPLARLENQSRPSLFSIRCHESLEIQPLDSEKKASSLLYGSLEFEGGVEVLSDAARYNGDHLRMTLRDRVDSLEHGNSCLEIEALTLQSRSNVASFASELARGEGTVLSWQDSPSTLHLQGHGKLAFLEPNGDAARLDIQTPNDLQLRVEAPAHLEGARRLELWAAQDVSVREAQLDFDLKTPQATLALHGDPKGVRLLSAKASGEDTRIRLEDLEVSGGWTDLTSRGDHLRMHVEDLDEVRWTRDAPDGGPPADLILRATGSSNLDLASDGTLLVIGPSTLEWKEGSLSASIEANRLQMNGEQQRLVLRAEEVRSRLAAGFEIASDALQIIAPSSSLMRASVRLSGEAPTLTFDSGSVLSASQIELHPSSPKILASGSVLWRHGTLETAFIPKWLRGDSTFEGGTLRTQRFEADSEGRPRLADGDVHWIGRDKTWEVRARQIRFEETSLILRGDVDSAATIRMSGPSKSTHVFEATEIHMDASVELRHNAMADIRLSNDRARRLEVRSERLHLEETKLRSLERTEGTLISRGGRIDFEGDRVTVFAKPRSLDSGEAIRLMISGELRGLAEDRAFEGDFLLLTEQQGYAVLTTESKSRVLNR